MAITRVNEVLKNHKKTENSHKTLRRKENKQKNRHNRYKLTLRSKHLANRLREVWDSESRQNWRWLIARQEARLISGSAADILHIWIKTKTPEERERVLIEPKIKSGSDAEIQEYKDAWIALTALKQERQVAMRQGGDGVTVDDWWHQGASKRNEMDEQDEVEDMEYAEEAEDRRFGDESDAVLVVTEGGEGSDEVNENEDGNTGDQYEPPEPVSP